MRVTLVVGARPNFMKAAPVLRALELFQAIDVSLLHTGQHYDERMSDSFFRELEIRAPDVNLNVGSGSHARQTAEVMIRFEDYLKASPCDLVVVAGDVNSTIACALSAAKLNVPVAHVESGLRSFDRTMPEEINRILTDAIASLLFVTERAGVENLRAEGVPSERVHWVGNTMIDTLLKMKPHALARPLPEGLGSRFGVVTLHRPSNVDSEAILDGLLEALLEISEELPLCWPIHPRTEKRLHEFDLWSRLSGNHRIRVQPPASYLDFLAMTARSSLVLTDSGGIQEEALVLKVPVVTIRENTERPVTVECGGNLLAGSRKDEVKKAAWEMLHRDKDLFSVPPYWDGKAGERIADVIVSFLKRGAGQ